MYYFASDIHLGLGDKESSRRREFLFISWLDEVARDASAIFIVGDMFDFWYEYRHVVPKGFTRLLGRLSELTDRGVEIHFFPGNHDMWAYSYLTEECGIQIHHTEARINLYGKEIFIAHGDDITSRERGFPANIMNTIFRSNTLRWLFSHLIHPDAAMKFGQCWSSHSRGSKSISHHFLAESEPMVQFAKCYSKTERVDYYIFGHNHCVEIYPLGNEAKAVFLGEWIENPAYAVLSPDGNIELRSYRGKEKQ